MDIKQEEQIIKKTTVLTMIANAFLAVIKIIVGILGKSQVLISDAINSISDVVTNIVVYISAIFSRKERDAEHPYGHEKIDSVISIFLGVAIIITAFEVGKNALTTLYNYLYNGLIIPTPSWYVLVVVAITILFKEFLFQKTKRDAKKAKSSALMAQAWDHRSDTLASFGAIIGITGAMVGWSFLEPIASFIIALFILRVGYKIISSGVSQVVDKAVDKETCKMIKDIIFECEDVKSLDDMKTRMFGMKIYIDLEIGLEHSMTLEAAHEIAESLHDKIEDLIPEVIHCMIHVNPNYDKKDEK